VILPAGYRKSLDTMKGQAYVPIVVWNRCSRQGFNPNDEHSRTTHGQYHLWQRQPGDDDRARDAARHQDQSRRLWPREGCWSRLADRLLLTGLPRKAEVEVSDVHKTR
jgi:hypothetical protein